MAGGIEVAQAVVTIIPSLQGAQQIITSELTSQGEAAGESAGKSSGEKFSSNFTDAVKTGATALGAAVVAATTATIALGKSFVDSAANVASFGDNIDKSSQKLGVSSTAYQEWDFVLQHSGSSVDALNTSMLKLNAAADAGSTAFASIGLSEDQIAQMNNEELFSAVITGLQGVSDETTKAQLANDLFGKSYTELMPLLNTSATDTEAMKQQAHDLGIVMSEENVKASAAFQDSLQNMSQSLTGIKNNLIAEFLPGMTTVMDGITAIFSGDSEGGMALIKQGLESISTKISEVLPSLIETAGTIVSSIVGAITENLPSILEQGAVIIGELIKGIVANAPAILTTIASNMGNIVLEIGKALPTILGAGGDIINSLLQGLNENLPGVSEAFTGLISGISGAFTGLLDTLSPIIDSIAGLITSLGSAIAEPITAIGNAVSGVITAVSDGVTSINNSVANILEKLSGVFQSIGQAAIDAGTGFATVADAAIRLANQTSVLDLVATLGGIANGIKDINREAKWMADNKIADALGNLGPGLQKLTSGAADLSTTNTNISTLAATIQSLNNEVKADTKTAVTNFGTAMKDMAKNSTSEVNNFKSSVENATKTIKALNTDAKTPLSQLESAVKSAMSNAASSVSTDTGKWSKSVSDAISAVKKNFSGRFSWDVPELKIPVKTPKFTTSGSWQFNNQGNITGIPQIKVEWYKRAAQYGAVFAEPAIIGVGDANEPEMLLGQDTLYQNIKSAIADAGGNGVNQTINITSPKYLDPAETARLVRNNTRQMLNRMKGGV